MPNFIIIIILKKKLKGKGGGAGVRLHPHKKGRLGGGVPSHPPLRRL